MATSKQKLARAKFAKQARAKGKTKVGRAAKSTAGHVGRHTVRKKRGR